MKNLQKKPAILLVIATLTIAASQVINQYVNIPDFFYGAAIGTGVGLLLVALLKAGKIRTAG